MSQSFGPTWMRPKESSSAINQSRSHDSNKNSWHSNGGSEFLLRGQNTPALSKSDILNSDSSPTTPKQVAENYDSSKLSEDPIASEILPNKAGVQYSMKEMIDILHDLQSKNLLESSHFVNTELEEDDYRSINGESRLAHVETERQNLLARSVDTTSQAAAPTSQSQDMSHLNLNPSLSGGSFSNQPTNGWTSASHENHSILNPLLSSTGNVSNHFGKPPGLDTLPSLLQPHQIHWIYLDSAGREQGPFDGNMMQNWFSGNYLSLDLQMRRAEDIHAHYQSLGEFINQLGNYQTPFLVPLPDLRQKIYQPQANSHPALQINTQPTIPQRVASPWAQQQSPASGFLTGTQSPFANQSAVGAESGLFDSTAGYLNTPQGSFIGLQQPQPQPLSQNQQAPQELQQQVDNQATHNDDAVLEQMHSAVLDHVLQEPHHDDHKLVKTFEESQQESEKKGQETPVVVAHSIEKDLTEPINKIETQSSSPSAAAKPFEPSSPSVELSVKPKAKPAAPAKPKLAPWASSSSISSNKPKLSLLEIQELEAKERLLKEQEELEREKKAAAAAAAYQLQFQNELAEASALSAAVEEKPALPRTASWATNKFTPVTPKKSLADIQKEEAEAAAATEAKNIKNTNTLAAQLADSASFASLISGPGSGNNSNAWTVVSKKPVTKPVIKTSVPGLVASSAKPTVPSVLRSVSSSTSTPAVAKTSPILTAGAVKQRNSRDEFFAWCRAQLSQLNKSVDKEDVLSILIQLPTSSESQEIIADTIYSNSSVMDGRRFAQEFCKRKQTIEKSVPHGVEFNWTDEMFRTMNAENDTASTASTGADNWDDAFKVVTKKNKKKNKEF